MIIEKCSCRYYDSIDIQFNIEKSYHKGKNQSKVIFQVRKSFTNMNFLKVLKGESVYLFFIKSLLAFEDISFENAFSFHKKKYYSNLHHNKLEFNLIQRNWDSKFKTRNGSNSKF